MPGEIDLSTMLATLRASRHPEPVTVTTVTTVAAGPGIWLGDGVLAVIAEAEGVTVVAEVDRAQREGWGVDFVAAWLTLDVHSALEAVGLTAAVAGALAAADIPCNVLAGFHHDHLLVPLDRAEDAITTIAALSG